MTGKLTWTDYWSMRAQIESQADRDAWDSQVGFTINAYTGKISLGREFHNFASNCSILELRDLLCGAPLALIKVYIHRLPLKYAKEVALHCRKEDLGAVTEAFNNPKSPSEPRQIAAPKEAV